MENYQKESKSPNFEDKAGQEFAAESLIEDTVVLEKEPGEPKLSFHIVFSPHINREHAELILEPLAECDIYVPEIFGASKEVETLYNQISRGELAPEEVIKQEGIENKFRQRELEIIFKSGKRVIILDVPDDHPIFSKIVGGSTPNPFDLIGSFEEAVQKFSQKIQEDGEAHKSREAFMLQQVKPKIQKLIQNDKELSTMDTLNVLFFLGIVHTNFSYQLSRSNTVTREFYESPFVFCFSNEATRQVVWGRELSQDLVAQCIAEIYIFDFLGELFKELGTFSDIFYHINFVYRFARKLNLKTEEIQALWEEESGCIPRDRIKDLLKKRGYIIPKTKEELIQMLEA